MWLQAARRAASNTLIPRIGDGSLTRSAREQPTGGLAKREKARRARDTKKKERTEDSIARRCQLSKRGTVVAEGAHAEPPP